MWEWSNQVNKPKRPEKISLLNAYDDLSLTEQLPSQFSSIAPTSIEQDHIPSISEMQNIAEKQLKEYQLSNMELIKKDYTPQTWQEMSSIFTEYQRARTAFLKLVAYSTLKDCIRLGFEDEEISMLKSGIVPENYNTHLKIPFDFGGNLSFNNFSLIKTHHIHSNIHRILDSQIACGFLLKHKKIFIPYFEGKFYDD